MACSAGVGTVVYLGTLKLKLKSRTRPVETGGDLVTMAMKVEGGGPPDHLRGGQQGGPDGRRSFLRIPTQNPQKLVQVHHNPIFLGSGSVFPI